MPNGLVHIDPKALKSFSIEVGGIVERRPKEIRLCLPITQFRLNHL
ncbi:Unknown protein sequence [Pseudomonas amygdali pv. lachrymans]|nr:Unknown protein sequence [Pseudomonas amygdali pv. lachrymans]